MAGRRRPRPDRPVHIPNNTKVYCANRHLIGRYKGHFREGDTPHVRNMRFEKGQERIAGEAAKCLICGHAYMLGGNIRTESGWLPADPASIERPQPGALRRR